MLLSTHAGPEAFPALQGRESGPEHSLVRSEGHDSGAANQEDRER